MHDWFVQPGGAENCIKEMLKIYPAADLYALIDFFDENDRRHYLNSKKVITSTLQRIPGMRKHYRKMLAFFPRAIEEFNLNRYDLVISSSHSVAKGVLTHSEQVHICYCYTPIRYAWDFYFPYLEDAGLTTGLKGWYARRVLHRLRQWDRLASQGVDEFIGISHFIKRRIQKNYRREAAVIYPPVDTDFYRPLRGKREECYFTSSRMVAYKRFDIIIQAFNKMPHRKLVVGGDGPEFSKLKAIARENIEFRGYLPPGDLKLMLQKCQAFIFASKEDFGIIPVEAQACATPVLAYSGGASLETVKENETGLFFHEQSPEAIIKCVEAFEAHHGFKETILRQWAEKFSEENFRRNFESFVKKTMSRAK